MQMTEETKSLIGISGFNFLEIKKKNILMSSNISFVNFKLIDDALVSGLSSKKVSLDHRGFSGIKFNLRFEKPFVIRNHLNLALQLWCW